MIANCAALSLAIVSAPDPAAPWVPALETWYVATTAGTRAMTLDELDEALARGEVDTSTPVWIPGMSEWEALGMVANLEDGPPLECTPGKMLEYGLDAERALQSEDGSVRPSVGDIRDYDPFSFPPPADNIPDPNRALWASILPASLEPTHTGIRMRVEPWWRLEGTKMPWIGLMLSGTFVLCMSLLGVARLLFAEPAPAHVRAATLTLQPSSAPELGPAAALEPGAAPVDASASLTPQSSNAPPTLVRYEEAPSAPEKAAARPEVRVRKATRERTPAARAARSRASRATVRRR
jgi:hypothetical protein